MKTLLTQVRSLIWPADDDEPLDNAEDVLFALARAIEAKDPSTMGHADRVAEYATRLGAALGVSDREINVLRQGGKLHDIGKIGIPDAILLKPGKYEPAEFEVMKRHPIIGCEICGKLRSISEAVPLIRHHHEKLDGSGYPDRLSGDQIPQLARIITIVDIFDALRSQRAYKEAFTVEKSFEIMWQEVEKGWWDRNILSAWEKIIRSSHSS